MSRTGARSAGGEQVTAPIVLIGETMARFSATSRMPLAHSSGLDIGIGGAESNVAIGLSRLGVSTIWAGRVGCDPLGDLVAGRIRAEGVDVRAIHDPDAPTGLMVKEHRTSSTTRVWYYRAGSAGSRLRAKDLADLPVEDAAAVHLTGITPGLSGSAQDAVLSVVARAKSAGTPISLDVNYREGVWHKRDFKSALMRLLPDADIVFGGDDEFRRLAPGSNPRSLAEAVSAIGPREVVVKLGAEGSHAYADGEHRFCPAQRVNVVDTVGAGDAFVAGYLAEWSVGTAVAGCLEVATQVAAVVCESEGDWEGLPTRAELGLLRAAEPVAR